MNGNSTLWLAKRYKIQMRHFSTQTKTPFNQSTMKNNTTLTHNVWIQNCLWCEVFWKKRETLDLRRYGLVSVFTRFRHMVHGIPTQKCEYTKTTLWYKINRINWREWLQSMEMMSVIPYTHTQDKTHTLTQTTTNIITATNTTIMPPNRPNACMHVLRNKREC